MRTIVIVLARIQAANGIGSARLETWKRETCD